ncbi:MAG TPA: TrmB family transcriptional regulator [Firmicutes bacterium]|nr:TrmB family transcriptional regulator [Candidatus Fermentithermobacillaceae bacterium]
MAGEDNHSRAIDILSNLGFTEYETKTYLSLLKNSPVTGYQISKDAGIPRSMVYEALGRLVNKGAVMSLPLGDTTRYAPVPVSVLLDNLRHKYEEALDAAHDVLSLEEQRTPLEQVWNIDGRDSVLTRAREMIRTCHKDLLMLADDSTLVELLPTLNEAVSRGLKARLILSGEAEVEGVEVVRHPRAESDWQRTGNLLVIVTDSSQCLIGGTGSSGTCIWTGNRHVVFIARQFIWQEIFTQRTLERLGRQAIEVLSEEERKAILGE